MFDVMIRGGDVLDGTGSPRMRADVGIKGQTIAAIGDLSSAGAGRVIDAAGHAVTPGFMDTHAHSDGALLLDPQHANGLRQGITTEFLGQDGLSYAPMSRESYLMARRYLAGIYGYPPQDIDTGSVDAFLDNFHHKVAVNVAYVLPHNALRLGTVGFHDRPLEGKRMEKAKDMLRQGMEQGAVGLSTGLSYFPNTWSTTDELVELCEVVAEYGRVFVTHLRTTLQDRGFAGDRYGEGAFNAAEALEIGRRSGVKVHISHYRTGGESVGNIEALMADVDEAKAEGVDCTLDTHPYPAGSSYPIMHLPAWANDGGPEAVIGRLKDPVARGKIVEFMAETNSEQLLASGVVSYIPSGGNDDLLGMSFADIASARGVPVPELICDLLIEEDLAVGVWWSPPDSVAVWRQMAWDCMELVSRPDYMVCSDSISAHTWPHPRTYGTFPRFFSLLRRHPVMTFEQMVQRMTDNPALRFGIEKRGRVQVGYYADIVVLDPDGVADPATYDDPEQYPIGIPYVLVNGRVAVDSERPTGVLAGQALGR